MSKWVSPYLYDWSEGTKPVSTGIVAKHAGELSEERQKALIDAIDEAIGDFAALSNNASAGY